MTADAAADAADKGGAGLFGAATPWLQAAGLALEVVAHFRAKSEAREAARRDSAIRFKDVNIVNDPEISIAYGLAATAGNACFPALSSRRPASPVRDTAAAFRRVVGETLGEALDTGAGAAQQGRSNEFFHLQHVLSAGEIAGLGNVALNGALLERWRAGGGVAGGVADPTDNGYGRGKTMLAPYGAASAFATAFSTRRSAASKGTGLSMADSVFQMPYSEKHLRYRRLFAEGAKPELFFHLYGRLLRDVTADGFGVGETWSDNLARVICDYATHGQYGPGLLDAEFNAANAAAFRADCGETWIGGGTALWNRQVPASIGAAASGRTYGAELLALGWRGPSDNGLVPRCADRFDADAWRGRRGAYNGLLETRLDYYAAFDQLANVFPGLIIYWGVDGALRFAWPDPWTPAADQVAAVIDETARPPGRFLRVVAPDSNDRAAHVVVSHNDVNADFAPVDTVWPPARSPERVRLRAMNGGRDSEIRLALSGVATTFHAAWIASSAAAVLNRRRIEDAITIGALRNAGGQAVVPPPGTVLRFTDRASGRNVVGRLDEIDIDFNAGIATLAAVEFFPGDYAPRPCPRPTERVGTVSRVGGVGRGEDTAGLLGYRLSGLRGASSMHPGEAVPFRGRLLAPAEGRFTRGAITWSWETPDGGAVAAKGQLGADGWATFTAPADAVVGSTLRLVATAVVVTRFHLPDAPPDPVPITVRVEIHIAVAAAPATTGPLAAELRWRGDSRWSLVPSGAGAAAVRAADVVWSVLPADGGTVQPDAGALSATAAPAADRQDGVLRAVVTRGAVTATAEASLADADQPFAPAGEGAT